MTRYLIAIALASVSCSSGDVSASVKAVTQIVWPVSQGGNGHLYELTPSAMTWVQAENYAVSLGGHLTSIRSAQEQAFVTLNFPGLVWIGLNDVQTEGQYEWTSGEPFDFSDWQVGEPNNEFGIEDYVATGWGAGSRWNDLPIDGTVGGGGLFGVVKRVPEPGSLILGAFGLGLLAWYYRRK